jgi:hypothetical protein
MLKTISLRGAVLWTALLGIVFVLASYSLISAQDKPSASGLQIAPTRTELTLKAGSKDNITLTLKNVTGGDILAKPEIDDFVSDNDTGTPKLITDNSQRSPFSIKDFISQVPSVTMKSGESKTLKIPVNIPAAEPPGGYFGVIRFIAEPLDNKSSDAGRKINLTASLGHIVLINVPGNVKQQLQLISFSAENNGKTGTIFSTSPDGMAIGLKNTGNSFEKPFGTVTIKNFKGKEVLRYEINNTDPRGNVLPQSTRVFHDKIKSLGSSPGRYSAVASVSYGTGGDVLVSEIHFWVIPTWLRVVIAAVIVLIILAIFYSYRKLKKQDSKYRWRRK